MSHTDQPIVTIETRGRVAIVRLDRGFHACPDISAVVLTGRDDTFSMGMDLKDPVLKALREQGLAQRRLSLRAGPRLCEAWEQVDAITICAIEGWCAGGGAALAVSCDLRVMGQSAMLYVPEVERGMNMTWGSIPRFTALVGPARAKRIAALCEKIDAPTALQWGLADQLCEDGQASAVATQLADQVSTLPPSAMKMFKHDVNMASHALARVSAHRDLEGFALLEQSEDFKEGVSSFLEGRPPNYTGN
jgi:enoyl-CoA hydratase/carnithine racemase